MPKHLFEQASVTLNGYDVSADISGAELMEGRRSPVDVTGLSDTFDSFLVPNLRRWSVKLPYFNNFDGTSVSPTGIHTVLKGVFNSTATSGVAFVLRATTNIRSISNPEWQGNVQLDGEFAAIAGNVAEADKGTVSLKGLGVLLEVTTAT
jgi:hypothetical protein